MAIQKNFVVKNGLEVDTDLIVADSLNNKVGIGTTVPRAKLEVLGGIAATDLNVSGISTVKTLVLEGPIAAGSLTSLGSTGQYLRSTYSGVEWASFPNFRTVETFTASDGQFVFPFVHTPGEVDVYVNGVKLSNSEYSDSSVDVTLINSSFQGDTVELVGYGVLGAYTGSTGISGITVLDEGVPVGIIDTVTSINFVGGDVVAAGTGAGVTVTIAPTDLNYIEGDARITGILTVGQTSVTINGPQNSIRTGTITTKELKVIGGSYSSLDFFKTVDNPVGIGSTVIILDSTSGIIVGDKITVVGVLTEASIVSIGTVPFDLYNRTFLNTFTNINIGIGSTAIGVASTTGVSIGSSISIVGIITNAPVVGFATVAVGGGYVHAALIGPGFAKTFVIPVNSPVGFSSAITQKDVVRIGTGSTINVGISSASTAIIQRFVSSSSDLNVSGVITAAYFYGNGSGLTNLGGSGGIGTQWVTTNVGIHTLSKVGIGTTAKSLYSLDVNGDLNFSGSLYQNGSSFVASRWTTGIGNDIYRLDGDVGIGTTNPSSKLSVTGNTYLNGSVGIGTTNPNTNLHVQGNIKVTGVIYDKDDNAGSAGYVISSNGSNITWIDGTSLGAQGTQGSSGSQGVQGVLGAQGNEGYVGQDGSQGSQGTIGAQGTQGIIGAQGTQGTLGAQGLQGLQGLDGQFAGQGTQGTLGAQGSQGTLGAQGSQGLNGSQGIQGAITPLDINSSSSGSFSVVLTSSTSGSISTISIGNTTSNPLIYNASIPGVGIGTTNISASLHLAAGKSAANGSPLKINSGLLLTSPEANAIEYDGINLFFTQNDTTNGSKRSFIDATQFYRLSADQTPISASTIETSVSWFGSGSSFALMNGYYYEIEGNLFFTKTTSGTVTLSFGSSSTLGYTSLTATSSIFGSTATGGNVNVGIAQTVSMSATGSIVGGVSGLIYVRGIIIPADNCRVTTKAHVGAGSITPKQDSYVKIRCLGNANSIGNFA
jgi:hypothetical protein